LIFHLGLPVLLAGNVLLFLNIGAIAGAPIGGLLADRVFRSPRRTGLLSLCFLGISILLLALWPGPVYLGFLAAVLFTLGFFAPFASLLFAHIKTTIPADMTGISFTGVNFFSAVGGAVFLHALGHLLDRGGTGEAVSGGNYKGAFLICFMAILVALFLYIFSREPKPDSTFIKES
jgi:sugar phosphate permease